MISVSFEYEGIQFDGYFTNKDGAGFDRYRLHLNGIIYGSLVNGKKGWYWSSGPMRLFEEDYMLEYFLAIVEKSSLERGNRNSIQL